MITITVIHNYTGNVDIKSDKEINFNLISATRIVINRWEGSVPLQKSLHYAWLKEIEDIENRPVFSDKTKQIAKRNGTISFLKALRNDILELCPENYDFKLVFEHKLITGDVIKIEEENNEC